MQFACFLLVWSQLGIWSLLIAVHINRIYQFLSKKARIFDPEDIAVRVGELVLAELSESCR